MARICIGKSALVLMLAAPLFLGACATPESVKQAQDTANAAKAEADQAMATAQQALSAAQQAEADAKAANEKANRMFQKGLQK